MKNILLNYLGIFFLFYYQVCVIPKKMSPEDARKKCIRSTNNVTEDRAEYLINGLWHSGLMEHDRCFLQCYFTYSNKIVIATLVKDETNSEKDWVEVFIGIKTPSSVTICIKEGMTTGYEKCQLGDVTHQCHLDFAAQVAKALNLYFGNTIDEYKFLCKRIRRTTEGNSTTTEGNTTMSRYNKCLSPLYL